MNVLLYRRSLDARSGAGQLIAMQAKGLAARGARVTIGALRGTVRFWLRTGLRARHFSLERANALAATRDRAGMVIDHGTCLPHADLTFVHNLYTEAHRFVPRPDWIPAIEEERVYFANLASTTTIVANSELVKAALIRHFALAPARIQVHYPGFRSGVFSPVALPALRARARASLGLEPSARVIGLVTSGDFAKRGLEVFLAAAARVAAHAADVRFLIVGSAELPERAERDALVRAGRVIYRPKGRHPERWLAALDLLLYPALFEEYGMVVAEAQALGVPVLTSRRVGAAECLPKDYAPWLLEEPDASVFADRALALLEDSPARKRLAEAAAASVRRFDDGSYVSATVAAILAQKR
jgi:glycosyltransferase involved in cell wall biosynthesis